MAEKQGIFVTERQRLFLWVVVGICLFLGVAMTSCLVTYAVLDTGASMELRVQVQELRGAVAELAGRQDNATLTAEELSIRIDNTTRAVEEQSIKAENITGVVEDLSVKADVTTMAIKDLSIKYDVHATTLTEVKTKEAEVQAKLANLSIQVDDNIMLTSEVRSKQEKLTTKVSSLTSFQEAAAAVLVTIASNTSSEWAGFGDCRDYQALRFPSGVYSLQPQDGQTALSVFCDMATEGGPWLVFQRRMDGSVNFTRNWTDYSSGFGDLQEEFWLGLEKLHRLTSAGLTQLRVDMATWEGRTGYALYSTFQVANSSDHFRLEVHGYSGNAGDDMYYNNSANYTVNGMQFSTYDQDHDTGPGSCAPEYKAGWWYNRCHVAHPNGVYSRQGPESSYYADWPSLYRSDVRSLKFIEMKIK